MSSNRVTVVVERVFDEPQSFDALQAHEDANAWCLETNDVTFLKSYFSVDRLRMICLYSAPDAEAVRRAQTAAEMPFAHIYAATEH